jgi:hypothetical protein
MRKFITTAAIVGTVFGGGIAAATAATAATPACVKAGSGLCGSEVNASGNALTVTGKIAVNADVVAEPDSVTSGRSDFIINQTTADADERTFELAPNNKPSGFCASQPSGSKRVVLRACNNSRFQRWVGVNTRNTPGTQWTNVESGGKIQGNGTGNTFIVVPKVTNVPGSFFGFDAAGVVPPAAVAPAAGI